VLLREVAQRHHDAMNNWPTGSVLAYLATEYSKHPGSAAKGGRFIDTLRTETKFNDDALAAFLGRYIVDAVNTWCYLTPVT